MIRSLLAPALWSLAMHLPFPAAATQILGADLQKLTVFSATDTTTGASTIIFGSGMAGGIATFGSGSSVWGDFSAVGATSLGGSSSVLNGHLTSAGAISIDAGTIVAGAIVTGAAATIGAGSTVGGHVHAAAAATVGAEARVAGDVLAGAAATIGADASVAGAVGAVAAITLGAGSSVGSQHTLDTAPVDGVVLAARLSDAASANQVQVAAAQSAFALMTTTTFLASAMAGDTLLPAGVYSADSLSIAASATLTLDGFYDPNRYWVFNIGNDFTTGALSRIVLLGGASGNSIIWNIGGFASLGADSQLRGTVLARSYVSVGANAGVTGVGGTCGGVFSALSYVTLGAGTTMGDSACRGIDDNFERGDDGVAVHFIESVAPLPEPSTWMMSIAGFSLLGVSLRRGRRSLSRPTCPRP